MKRMKHMVAHWLGWNRGWPYAFYRDGVLMVGFFCDGCGELSGVHEAVKEAIL